jgi:hypothetical protein
MARLPLSHNPAAVQLEVSEGGIAERGLQRFDEAIAHEDAALDARAHPEIGPGQGSGRNRDVAVLEIAERPMGLGVLTIALEFENALIDIDLTSDRLTLRCYLSSCEAGIISLGLEFCFDTSKNLVSATYARLSASSA